MSNKPNNYLQFDREEMSSLEKSAIIGYYRNGMPFEVIAAIMGISEKYVTQIIDNYIKKKK